MKKNLNVLLVLLTLFSACQKITGDKEPASIQPSINLSSQESKFYFAKTLAKALENESDLRDFIKRDGLKMFDNEYDVFYQMVKNSIVSSSETFYDKVVKYAGSKDTLDAAIKDLPLLTIFVPELPEFTPQSWEVSSQIPVVAVEPEHPYSKDSIRIFSASQVWNIPHGIIPGFPTLVIKDNERVILKKENKSYGKNTSNNQVMAVAENSSTSDIADIFLRDGTNAFVFADEVFNGSMHPGYPNISKNKVIISNTRPDRRVMGPERTVALSQVQHIIDAISTGQEWQRDNIYYGINESAGITSGPVKRNIRECLTSIRFTSVEAYGTIGDDPDSPQPVSGTQISQEWTDGSYEFRLKALINKKNGPGAEIEKVFFVRPGELFFIRYRRVEGPRPCTNCLPSETPSSDYTYFEPYIDGTILYVLPEPLVIDSWNLDECSVGWKINFSKFNPQQTVTTTVSQGAEFATNFEINAQLGEKIKVGAKYGSSAKYTNTQTYTITTVFGPDNIGDANAYFYDPVILTYTFVSANQVKYAPYELSTGAVNLAVEPRIIY